MTRHYATLTAIRHIAWLTSAILTLLLSTTVAVSAPETPYGHYSSSRFSDSVVAVNWNSTEGQLRLSRAAAAGTAIDFFQLAHHYQPQTNGLYCGIASSVIVLNALRAGQRPIPSQPDHEISIPPALGGGRIPYPLYAQSSFLNESTEPVKPRSVIEFTTMDRNGQPNPGLMLQELRGILDAYGAAAQAHHADAEEAEGTADFRKTLIAMLSDIDHFLIVNYDSRALGQAGSGHISPLAAYDAVTDSVLILDVSGQMNPWLWVPLRDLYLAMHTRDGAVFRGYVIVKEGLPSRP